MGKRTVSVKELVEMFVAISYLQEQRIIDYSDIYDFIDDNQKYTDVEFIDLIDEAVSTLNELVNDGILSNLYPNKEYGLYRVNDKIDFLELSKHSEDYLQYMNKIFFDIIKASEHIFAVTLTLSNTKNKNR